MRKLKVPAVVAFLILLLITLPFRPAAAQDKTKTVAGKSDGKFDLKDGDRVVFLGNSVFENDFQYGYLELALTTRFPDRFVTYRNLGWTGDNVFGDARSTFTNPPTAYQHLIANITKTQPSVVFLAYGGVEAQEGEAGLAHFKDGLNNLLNKIDSLGAKTIILSPIPFIGGDSAQNIAKRNADIELYSAAMAKMAESRGKEFIDIYHPIKKLSEKFVLTENGIHLNETGYYHLAMALEQGLGLSLNQQETVINVDKNGLKTSPTIKIKESARDNSTFKFTVQEDYLPLPMPSDNPDKNTYQQLIKITGLKKGFYTLKADESNLVTASAKDWEQGVQIKRGISFNQVNQLREMIVKKNNLFFFQYRPINETYIIGFRAYEQGKHVKDLDDQNILIKFLESQIALERVPKPHVYELSVLK